MEEHRLDLVMLVDDNETDNFISKRIIEITDFAQEVVIKSSGKSALEYIGAHRNEPNKLPDLIFPGYQYAYRGWVCISCMNLKNLQNW